MRDTTYIMPINIFYSWQSDLPNKSNRGLIKDCLEKAVKKLGIEAEIDFNVDRDTKDTPGTPDIIKTIFDKIEKSHIFICDISIINSEFISRKTPNPNVLIELGYAAKVLTWDRVICIYNTDYGSFEDLPFDIRQRRPLPYSTQIEKYKESLTGSLQNAVKTILTHYPIEKRVNDFIKVEIDTEILSFINHLHKIFKHDNEPFSFEAVSQILNSSKLDIEAKLSNKKLLGFKVFKNWSETEKNINSLLDKPLIKSSIDNDILKLIVTIIWRIKEMEKLLSAYYFYEETDEFSAVHTVSDRPDPNGPNGKLPNRLILLRHLKDDKFLVEDSGDFIPKLDKKLLLRYYCIKDNAIPIWADVMLRLFRDIEKWLDFTDNEFLVDIHMFRLHKVNAKIDS